MATAARLPIAADRAGACVRTLFFDGLDLTGITLALEMRVEPEAPGPAPIALGMVTDVAAEGLRLVEVKIVNGRPISRVSLRVAEATMKDNAKLPYSGEAGAPSTVFYDLIAIFGVDKRRLCYGTFSALPTVYGMDAAPAARPAGGTSQPTTIETWSNATLTFTDDQVTIKIDGADFIGSIAAGATVERQAAQDAAMLSERYANAGTDEDIPGAKPGERGARYYADLVQALFATAQAVLPKKTGAEANAGAVYRVLWGMRELARFSKAMGWQFQRLRLRASDTVLDDSTTLPLLKDRVARPTGPEVGGGFRWRIGNRLLADMTIARGFYPRKMTIPAQARVDDDPSSGIADRLAGVINGGRSGPDIFCSGDSLTAASYPTALATLTGRTVRNGGVGGETSRTIAGRVGVWPMLVTVSGGTIPANGGVTVTLASMDGGSVNPLLQHVTNGLATINPCRIYGVEGSLTRSSDTFTFTRTAAGDATPVPFPAALVTNAYRTRAGDIQIMEWGQNDSDLAGSVAAVIARQRALIDWMDRPVKRWLVSGFSTGTTASRANVEAEYRAAYGRRFVNIREYLSSPAAMAHAGLTPTQADLDAMAVGTVPPSLRSDDIHLNTAGYAEKAYFIFLRLKELEWL